MAYTNKELRERFDNAQKGWTPAQKRVALEQTRAEIRAHREDMERRQALLAAKHELGVLLARAVGAQTTEEVVSLTEVLCQSEAVTALRDVVLASADAEEAFRAYQSAWSRLVDAAVV